MMLFYFLAALLSPVESLKVILDPDDLSYDRAVDTYFKAVGIESEDDEFFSQFGGLLERSQKGLLASRKMKQLKVRGGQITLGSKMSSLSLEPT